MRLSELQLKEIINIYNGKRIGVIVDVIGRKFSKEEYEISWNQIVKIGDDIILIDTRNK